MKETSNSQGLGASDPPLKGRKKFVVVLIFFWFLALAATICGLFFFPLLLTQDFFFLDRRRFQAKLCHPTVVPYSSLSAQMSLLTCADIHGKV